MKACVLDAIPSAERSAHRALLSRLFTKEVREKQELENGYAFRFPVAALEDVTRFVANERRCCPFLDFVIDSRRGAEQVWLRVTGPDGTHAFLDTELPI